MREWPLPSLPPNSEGWCSSSAGGAAGVVGGEDRRARARRVHRSGAGGSACTHESPTPLPPPHTAHSEQSRAAHWIDGQLQVDDQQRRQALLGGQVLGARAQLGRLGELQGWQGVGCWLVGGWVGGWAMHTARATHCPRGTTAPVHPAQRSRARLDVLGDVEELEIKAVHVHADAAVKGGAARHLLLAAHVVARAHHEACGVCWLPRAKSAS